MNLGIAGVGFVGGAIQKYFESQGKPVTLFDPPRSLGSAEELQKCDLVFISVPTPYTETGFDTTSIDTVLPLLKHGTKVVIKSTVLPGTTDTYQKKFPGLFLFFSPEFLSQKTAVEDFAKPTRQIVGYTDSSVQFADEVLALLPFAPYQITIKAREAEMVKYMNNVFYALKVTYANQIYDLCESLGIDYATVMKGAVTNEPWMGTNHWDALYGGYRGYGGKCLPKDTRSLIQFGKKLGADVSLLELIETINNKRVSAPPKE